MRFAMESQELKKLLFLLKFPKNAKYPISGLFLLKTFHKIRDPSPFSIYFP